MNENRPLHILTPGQELSVRWRDATGIVLENIRRLRLANDYRGNPNAAVWITHIDETGKSFYIKRGYEYGGDMEIFIPSDGVMWQSYFEPYTSVNQSYVLSKHYTKVFPDNFIQ